MSYLPDLRTSLVEAARRQREIVTRERRHQDAMVARGGRRVGWRAVLVIVIVVLAGTAVALAASGVFERGSTIGPEVPPSPRALQGVAIPGSVRLLPLRVADPGGGPPWGLRVLRTTRGLTCVQLGRVAFGTVGALGQDGAFGNDGRFHPMSENYLETPFGCAVTDARGNGFLNAFLQDAHASALVGGPISAGGCAAADASGPHPSRFRPHRSICPSKDLRDISYGLLGPDAVSITHRTATGGLATTPTTGPDGAYLVVLPHATKGCLVPNAPRRCPGLFTGGPDLGVGTVTAVTYRDGHTCHVPPPASLAAWLGPCPPVGFVAPRVQRLTTAQLATPISVRKIPAKSYCARLYGDTVKPCGARVPRGFKRLNGGSLLVEISFTSRIAIPNSRSFYEFNLTLPHGATCTTNGEFGPTNADIRKGQRVTTRTFVPYRCPGLVRGNVTYIATVGPATSTPVPGLPGQAGPVPVGNFSFRVP
jgi:hypothetical protein